MFQIWYSNAAQAFISSYDKKMLAQPYCSDCPFQMDGGSVGKVQVLNLILPVEVCFNLMLLFLEKNCQRDI